MIGSAWSRYRAALKGLEELDLEPEFYRYDPSGGWAVRFQVRHVTGCALYLAKSLTGLVAIGARAEAAMETDRESDDQMRRLVLATKRKGKTRWVQMPLRSQEDVHRFLELVGVRVRAWQQTPKAVKPTKATKTPKAAKAPKAVPKTVKTAAKVVKTAPKSTKAAPTATKTAKAVVKTPSVGKAKKTSAKVNHIPRRRTSAAAAGRKKADTRPRRSAARRSSRG